MIPESLKPFNVSREDLQSITDLELAFGTTRLLPAYECLPSDFKRGNAYTKIAECLFCDQEPPACDLSFNQGYTEADAPFLMRAVTAHLRSFEPKHEAKIAGVGLLISKVVTLS